MSQRIMKKPKDIEDGFMPRDQYKSEGKIQVITIEGKDKRN